MRTNLNLPQKWAPFYIACNGLWVLKNSISQNWSKNFALGCPTNLQTTFLKCFRHFQILAVWEETGLFQHPRLISLIDPKCYSNDSWRSWHFCGRVRGFLAPGPFGDTGPQEALNLMPILQLRPHSGTMYRAMDKSGPPRSPPPEQNELNQ